MSGMGKKRILFVEPMGAPSNVFAKFMTIPLLGPVYLSEIARLHGHEAFILSENILGRQVRLPELVWADVLCLSCMTTSVNRGKEIAQLYREARSANGLASRTVIGGIHASMLPGDVAKDFDQVVTGEAENVFMDIIEERRMESLVQGGRLECLDELPITDFQPVMGRNRMKIWPVMTSRGCPHHCNFCSVTEMFGRGFRCQSPARIMKQLEKITRGRVFFADDNFAVNLPRAEELVDRMIAGRFGLQWSAQVRTDITRTPALVRKMRKAGCSTVYVGFESIHPESLRSMRKGQSPADIERSIRVFHENGISILGMFILGHDTDTPEVFQQTIQFCQNSRLDFVQYTVLTPLPGTPLFGQLEKEGRLLHRDWKYYDGMHAVFLPKNVTAKELQTFMIRCFSAFYSYRQVAVAMLQALFRPLLHLFIGERYASPFISFPIRFAGCHILRNWTKRNRFYLRYLEQFKGRFCEAETMQRRQ